MDTARHEKYQADAPKTRNAITKDLQITLRKWKYNFDKSEGVIAEVDKEKKLKQDLLKKAEEQAKNGTKEKVAVNDNQASAEVVAVSDDTSIADPEEIDLKDIQTEDGTKRLGPVPDQDLIATRVPEKIVVSELSKSNSCKSLCYSQNVG